MQTEHLIDLLSTNLDAEPADLRQLSHVLRRSLFIAAATTFGTSWVLLGIRPDLHQATTIAAVSGQVLVAGVTIAIASVYLFRLARPGGEYKTSLVAVGIPFGAAFLLAGIGLGLAPSAQWQAIAFAGGWLKCLVLIPLIAFLPFAIIAFAMHRAARLISCAPAPSRVYWLLAWAWRRTHFILMANLSYSSRCGPGVLC